LAVKLALFGFFGVFGRNRRTRMLYRTRGRLPLTDGSYLLEGCAGVLVKPRRYFAHAHPLFRFSNNRADFFFVKGA